MLCANAIFIFGQLPQVTGDGLLSWLTGFTCLVVICNQVMQLVKGLRKPDPSPSLHEMFANRSDSERRLSALEVDVKSLQNVQADARLSALESDIKALLATHTESVRNTHERINDLLRAISRVEGLLNAHKS